MPPVTTPHVAEQYTQPSVQPPSRWSETAKGLVALAQLVAVAAATFAVLGFLVWTPTHRLTALERKSQHQEVLVGSIYVIVSALARERCQSLSPHDWQNLGLPCPMLLQGQRLPLLPDSASGEQP
jgi:hypothetical protein